jgi:hypothetical protein
VTGLQPLARPLVQWASQFRLKIYTAIKHQAENIHSKIKMLG